jgi:hypothetical protein
MSHGFHKLELYQLALLARLHKECKICGTKQIPSHGARWYTAPGRSSSNELKSLKPPTSRRPDQPLRDRNSWKSSSVKSVRFSVVPVMRPDSSYRHTFTVNPELSSSHCKERHQSVSTEHANPFTTTLWKLEGLRLWEMFCGFVTQQGTAKKLGCDQLGLSWLLFDQVPIMNG